MRKRVPREPVYPEGDDSPQGVVFYLINPGRLDWDSCFEVVRGIAVDFAQNGPFRVRFGRRRDGDNYWLGLNAVECGDAFEAAVDISRYKITKATKLPGGNPSQLKSVLGSDEFRSYQQSGAPEPMEDWGASAPQPQYADHYTGVVFYRLDSDEIELVMAIEAINDIAAIMLHPMGRAKPFALRKGIRKDSPPHYWVGLNSSTAGVLFERTLEELKVRVTRRTRMPGDDPHPTLRLVLSLPGVPVLPLPPVPQPVPPPLPIPDWGLPDLDVEEPPQVQRDRMAWARSIDVGAMAARLGSRLPRRRRQPSEDS